MNCFVGEMKPTMKPKPRVRRCHSLDTLGKTIINEHIQGKILACLPYPPLQTAKKCAGDGWNMMGSGSN